ncbi:hypothetical protein [Sphingomonas lenta]|uniref:Uncharacterized protein n=1 Tax=Sphingomonas lenta TaxID=1141887 RepID=A0A2A2SBA6_9SPHN|nr:hypothetical protein [Sphingomonas lenta]PAX06537.1 hypothetical protein CKY28_15395 [Sphingomonas lenta]
MREAAQVELSVEEDGAAVWLRVLGGEGELFGARLEGPELDDLIRALADGRARLADAVAPELDEGARITDVTVDPAYLVGKNSDKGQALVAFRHPGLGWLGFQLRRDVVAAMVDRLGSWLGED